MCFLWDFACDIVKPVKLDGRERIEIVLASSSPNISGGCFAMQAESRSTA